MTGKKTFLLTTPIYYPSDYLHIGHTYTTVAADVLKKFRTIQGYDTFFVTGTDEHGLKIEENAKKAGLEPKEYVDKIVKEIKKLWEKLEIDYDSFIRTTDEKHIENIQKIFTKLYEKGDIYKDIYRGYYCIPCESFWTESQLENGLCPDCGREVNIEEEETYFFRLSKYTDKLLKLYEDNPNFILPESRKNEMINNFLKPGLEDLSVTRSTFDWGIKVPFDQDHVVYVWIDALFSYLSALGFNSEDETNYLKYWPANVHLVGKEIVRFHTIIWPAFLMALDIDLPKEVFGHGWILFDDDKMSKSKGNIVYPEPIIDSYGIDAYKYFILREFTFGSDGSFNKKAFLQRYNSDLANDLGNLLSRTVSMIDQYNGGIIKEPNEATDYDSDLIDLAKSIADKVEGHMDRLNYSGALEEIWSLIRRTNKYIDQTQPWILGREGQPILDTVLYNLAEALRIISILIEPFMGHSAREIRKQLGLEGHFSWEQSREFGLIPAGSKVAKGQALFQRLDIEKELKDWDKKNQDLIEARAFSKKEEEKISFEDFSKVKLKLGQVLECEDHPDADKLYILKLDLGDEVRQIVSGIRQSYTKEELIGKKLLVVTNLAPIKLRGVESNGMILAGDDGKRLSLMTSLEDLAPGTEIS